MIRRVLDEHGDWWRVRPGAAGMAGAMVYPAEPFEVSYVRERDGLAHWARVNKPIAAMTDAEHLQELAKVRRASAKPEEPTVLVVDPDEDARRICCMALGMKGFRVIEAETADEAAVALTQQSVRVVITETYDVPGGSVLERVHAMGEDRPRVLALTSQLEPDYRYDGWLIKPCAPSMLLAQVELLARSRR